MYNRINKTLNKDTEGKEVRDKVIIYVDGELQDENYLKKMSPDDIYQINVYKDAVSKKIYNTNKGVILITTKAKKERDNAEKEKKEKK